MNIARNQVAAYGSTPTYKKVLELMGEPDLQGELNALVRQGKIAETPRLVTDEVLSHFVIRGGFDEISDRIREKYDGVVERLGLYIPVIGGPREGEWSEIIRDLA